MRWRFYPQIFLKFLENIYERRRFCNSFLYRKAKPVCLSRLVIRVLSQDHCLDLLVWCELQRIENIVHIGINRSAAVFMLEKLPQLQIIILVKFALQDVVPAVSDVYHVRATRLSVLPVDGVILSYQKADWNIFPDSARTKIFVST